MFADHEPFDELDIQFGAYAVVRDDHSQDNDSPQFFGLRSQGRLFDKRLVYWSDIAWARGEERKSIDVEVDGDGDEDTDFRQTDLQGNSDKFGGIVSLEYYGEQLDPELSNMHIVTTGIGIRPLKHFSLDLVYHLCQQDHALDELRDTTLDEDPDGVHQELGDEIDLVAGFEKNNTEVELVVGYFRPGAAFNKDVNSSYVVNVALNYKF